MTDRRTIEARTVRNMGELLDFLDAARIAAGVGAPDADTIHFASPVDFRLVAITLSDGSTVYDLDVAPWKG